jgi:hypothetical protein
VMALEGMRVRRGAREDGQGGGPRGDHFTVALEGDAARRKGGWTRWRTTRRSLQVALEGIAARRKGGWPSWKLTRSKGA